MIVAVNFCLTSSIPIPSWTIRRNISPRAALSQITGSESNSLVQQSSRRSCLCYDMHKEVIPFSEAWSWQKSIVEERKTLIDSDQDGSDALIVLQHQSVYTLGTASSENNLNFDRKDSPFPLYQTERGGEVTYHGPGQLVMYPIMNLRYHKMDLHWYLRALEEVVIRVLFSTFGLTASRVEGLTGVWVDIEESSNANSNLAANAKTKEGVTRVPFRCRVFGMNNEGEVYTLFGDKKLAAIGIRVSRWLTYHGLALNVSTDLSPFNGIIPCGIRDRGVGSIKELVKGYDGDDCKLIDIAHHSLLKEFCEVFQVQLCH